MSNTTNLLSRRGVGGFWAVADWFFAIVRVGGGGGKKWGGGLKSGCIMVPVPMPLTLHPALH